MDYERGVDYAAGVMLSRLGGEPKENKGSRGGTGFRR